MPYIGKKPADIIATAVDTTTGTFSGDLTVDTNTLYVDSANNNVGIGTTSPAPASGSDTTLEIAGSSGPSLTINDTGQAEKYSLLANADDLKIYYGSTPMVSFQNDGNVGIGTSSPNSRLTSASTDGSTGLSIHRTFSGNVSGETTVGGLDFTLTDTATSNQVVSRISPVGSAGTGDAFAGSMRFYTAGSNGSIAEAMRIDSDGNLLVGKTSSNIATVGAEFRANGIVNGTRSSDPSGYFNRTTSDGSIVEFRKDNTAVGSIGNDNTTDLVITATDDMFFNVAGASNNILQLFGGSSANSQVKFDSPIFPLSDNTRDIGNSSERWKDLYLSGGVNIKGSDPKITLEHSNENGTAQIYTTAQSAIILDADPDNTDNGTPIVFKVDGSEVGRFDDGGNLLVGGTETVVYADTSGNQLEYGSYFALKRETANSSQAVAYFNNTGSNGNIIDLRKDGTTVGTIGSEGGDALYIVSGDTGLRFSGGSDIIIPATTNGAVRDNAIDLGSSGARFDDIFATNGTIQTSDRNEKNTITDSDLGIDFIKRLEPKSYIFNDKTRTHYGLIAQDVETVLSDISKPTSGFAGFIKDDISEEQDGSQYRYGLRYTEFVAPLIQAVKDQQAIIEDLQARIVTLENA